MKTAILSLLPCLLVLLTILCHPVACKPASPPTTSNQPSSTSSQVMRAYRGPPVSTGKEMESMETAHTLIYGTSGAPYLCLPANPPPLSFSRRSGGAYKKKPRRGYSKYPWNYQ